MVSFDLTRSGDSSLFHRKDMAVKIYLLSGDMSLSQNKFLNMTDVYESRPISCEWFMYVTF